MCHGSTTPFCQVNFLTHPYTYAEFTAVFVLDIQIQPLTKPLTVSLAGSGAGSVTGSGIDCPADCSQDFVGGATILLTATPGPLSRSRTLPPNRRPRSTVA
jgi:hypothetical protein